MDIVTGLLTGDKLEWMIASFCMGALSTIVFNLLQDRVLGEAKTDRWQKRTFAVWFPAWFFPDTTAYAVVLALVWLGYLKRRCRPS